MGAAGNVGTGAATGALTAVEESVRFTTPLCFTRPVPCTRPPFARVVDLVRVVRGAGAASPLSDGAVRYKKDD